MGVGTGVAIGVGVGVAAAPPLPISWKLSKTALPGELMAENVPESSSTRTELILICLVIVLCTVQFKLSPLVSNTI